MKVLLADDDAIARMLVSRLLVSFGYEVVTASDGDAVLKLLNETEPPEMMLIDWNIRGVSASSICVQVIADKNDERPQMIALVPGKDKQQREDALEAGCDDYVTKPVDAVEVRTRLRNAARLVEMSRRAQWSDARQPMEASHDLLTGFWNRAAILEFLTGQFARSSRDGVSVAVAMADVDKFAPFNERYGRTAGDALLRQIASRMRSIVRPYDWLGRTEADSFLIIAPDCTLSNGFAMCERLRRAVAECVAQSSFPASGVTMSFGLATTAESGAANEDALLRAAEAALYQAQQSGGNRVETARRVARPRPIPGRRAQATARELVQ